MPSLSLLFFSSPSCAPCKVFEPIAEKVARKLHLEYEKVRVDTHQAMTNEYRVQSVPTIIVVDDVGTRYEYTGPHTESALKSFVLNVGG